MCDIGTLWGGLFNEYSQLQVELDLQNVCLCVCVSVCPGANFAHHIISIVRVPSYCFYSTRPVFVSIVRVPT